MSNRCGKKGFWTRKQKKIPDQKRNMQKWKMQMYRKQTFLAIMKQIEIHRKCCTYFVNESNMKQWNVTRFLNIKSHWNCVDKNFVSVLFFSLFFFLFFLLDIVSCFTQARFCLDHEAIRRNKNTFNFQYFLMLTVCARFS